MNSSGMRRVGNILDTLWYAGSAAETLMVLLALLALTLGLATVFPQLPPRLVGTTADRWLASTAGNYPGFGRLLGQIGIFAIFESSWLRVVGALLAFNVALRLAIQAAALVQLARDRRNPATFLATGGGDAGAAGVKTRPTILATCGALMAYTGALIILAGLFLNGIAGWRATEIALASGSSTALRETDGPWLSLEELKGSETDPIARIALAGKEDKEPTSAGQIAVGQPIRWANLWIALRSAGPALAATARDSRGRPLLLQSLEPDSAGGLNQGKVSEEVHLLFQQTQAEQEFALPSANLSFRVVSYPSLPEQGIDVPVFLVEVYKGDEAAPALSDFVVDNATLMLNGTRLELQRDRYAIVDVANLPGLIPLLLGGLAILGGITIVALWSTTPRSEDEVEVKSPAVTPDTEPANAS
jgi:hypothetical protein